MNFWLLLVSQLLPKKPVDPCSFQLLLKLLLFSVRTGFDLCEVGQEEVVLKTGKLANRRTLHFALQSLLALFGKYMYLLIFLI